LPIESPDLIGQEAGFADAVLAGGAAVVLICYEHHRIPALVRGIPTVDGTAVPPSGQTTATTSSGPFR
jgi:hypothetical protein